MLKTYSRFLDIIEKAEEFVLTLTVPAMVFVMVYQVILRYIFSASNSWSDELTRYLFIFNVMMAAAIAIRRNSHLQIDVLINNFGPKLKSFFTIVATVAGIVFLAFLFKYSLDLCVAAFTNISAGLNLSMAIPYASIPMGCILMILTSIEVVLKNIQEFKSFREVSNS